MILLGCDLNETLRGGAVAPLRRVRGYPIFYQKLSCFRWSTRPVIPLVYRLPWVWC